MVSNLTEITVVLVALGVVPVAARANSAALELPSGRVLNRRCEHRLWKSILLVVARTDEAVALLHSTKDSVAGKQRES